jgi:hypothetical protein
MARFYNYIYIDPRKPGKYSYPNINMSFLYEPILVGKGSGERYLGAGQRPIYFKSRIQEILVDPNLLRENLVFKFSDNQYEDMAYENEAFLIRHIGRMNSGDGPLLNLSDGKGISGMIGNQNHFFGKHHKEKSKNKMRGVRKNTSLSKSKSWLITWPNGKTEVIINLWKFAPANNLTYRNLHSRGYSKGVHVSRIEETNVAA